MGAALFFVLVHKNVIALLQQNYPQGSIKYDPLREKKTVTKVKINQNIDNLNI